MTKALHASTANSFVARSVAKTVLIYACVAALWILLSDRAVILITTDPERIVLLSTLKGWFFVLVTSILLTYLVRRDLQALSSVADELRQSEERFSTMIEEAVDAFFQGDAAGNFIGVNEQSCLLTGYAREELLAMNMRDLFAPEVLARAELRYDLLKQGKVLTTERYLTRKDGSTVPVEMKSRLMSDGTYQSLFRDLTQRKKAEEAIHRSEARLRRAELESKTGNWELHLDSKEMIASEGAARIYGVDKLALDYAYVKTVPLPEYRPMLDAALHDLLTNVRPYDVEFRIKAADTGEIKAIHSMAMFDPEQRVVFGVIQDITARKEVETRLQLASSVFTHAREGILITDVDGAIIEVNEMFTRITGYGRDEVLGQNPRLLKSGRHTDEFYAGLWRALTVDGHWTGEIWNRRRNGDVFAEMLTISSVSDAAGKITHYVGLFSDITLLKEHQKQLETMAHYDALTGLPNRALLADRLRQAVVASQRRKTSLAVLYLDLDGFKSVNDRHGHDVGDELLISVTQRMKEAMREGDTLGRLGGDEFVAVLVDLETPQDCEPVLARLLQATAKPVTVGGIALQISASIGVTLYPQDDVDADKLLRHADQAMYLAKQAGKNRYHVFDVAKDAAVKVQRESIENIRGALTRREFVLYYQPKVNLKTGVVVGVEALIRWQHPRRGLLPPVDFLPLIEDHPLAIELGEWVIDAALFQMAQWYAAGVNIPISVNVGARQLQQHDFAQRLASLLAAHPTVRPGCLELEVLETSALEDMTQVSRVMHACCALGVSFALDDFGTGYSSLTYLKSLPADLLKIDQSFVRGMIGDKDDLSIVDAVVGLAEAFRRKVIAEGMETVAHGRLLLHLGCELAQGHAIARPMPAELVPGWVAVWRPDPDWTA